MSLQQHSFSIENTTNLNTGIPFGSKYGGTFSVRRATLGDKTRISNKEAAERNAFGIVNAGQTPQGLELAAYFCIFIATVATEPLPKWFDRDSMFDDDDEAAVFAVWQEVDRFQKSFRRGSDPDSSKGASE